MAAARPSDSISPSARPAGPEQDLLASGFRTVGRWGAVALLVAATAACASGSAAPPTYDLTAPTAVRLRASANSGQVVVAVPAAVQILSGQQIIVKDGGGSLSALPGGQWADQLPSLVQARLIQTFENASRLRAVARPSSGVAADYQLLSEIRAFQVTTPANEALVEISAKLVNEQNGRIAAGRIFSARVPVGTIDAANAAHALDEALATVLLDIVRWTGANSALPSAGAARQSPATPS